VKSLTRALAAGLIGVAATPFIVTPTAAGPAIVTIQGAAIATAPAVRIAPPTPPPAPPPGSPGYFNTLPPGTPLPSDATCASLVRPQAERRTINNAPNHTRGVVSPAGAAPVAGQPITGNFTGTTEEIMQWVACKWGIDEDVVRAQIAIESWWHMDAYGDMTSDQSACHPRFRTSTGSCPESIGLGQVRYVYHVPAFANDNAIDSSAYNLDYTYSRWRGCFEGYETWFNQFERGEEYAAGDMWGCAGAWFAGRWHTQDANGYIVRVQDYLNRRIWETADFQAG
jgi:autotransporter family porin